jgi:hypothetical protein
VVGTSGKALRAGRPGDGERADLAGLDVHQAGGGRIDDELDLAGQERGQHRRGAAIRHMLDLDAGFELEQFEHQVRPTPKPCEPKLILPGLALA